jgi:large subunit ribosomal protein L23
MSATKAKKTAAGDASTGGTAGSVDEKLFHVILSPHVSEKSSRLADKHRQMVFEVRRDASKPEIRQAVEKMFNVQVESVTVTNVLGKRKGGRITGRRQDWKKAYVRLKPGQDINFVGQQ